MVSIIIPVYNEERYISAVIEKVKRADTSPREKEIIVVDDGSTDGTGVELGKYSTDPLVKIVNNHKNRGKASAIKSALALSKGDIILVQDSDLEYSPDDYPKILAPFSDESVEVVYGSRFLLRRWPRKMKPSNWLANRIFTLTTNLLYNARITDEGTAYKAFRRNLLESMVLESTGFEFCPEVTAKVLLRGLPIVEVPISYEARNMKEGKKPRFSDGVKILGTLIRYRFRG